VDGSEAVIIYYFTQLAAFRANYIIVTEARLILLATKVYHMESIYHLWGQHMLSLQ